MLLFAFKTALQLFGWLRPDFDKQLSHSLRSGSPPPPHAGGCAGSSNDSTGISLGGWFALPIVR